MPDAAPQPQRIPCPHCQASIKAPPIPAGSSVNCPRCGQPFLLGQAAAVVIAAARPATGSQPAATGPAAPAARPAPRPQPPAASQPASAPQPTTSAAPVPAPPQRTTARPRATDGVVDPMLQPVVRARAPKPKPEHTEFGLTCKLCGTRVYARPEQVGQQIQCPDCHSAVDVVAPPRPKAQPRGPSLDDVEEVTLGDPGQRPRYRPMVRPQGEDAVLGLLNDPPFDVRTGQPRGATAEFPAVGEDPASSSPQQSSPLPEAPGFAGQGNTADEEDDDFELRLSDPVERPEVRVELPHHIAADLPDPRDEGSYGDELWGSGSSGTRPRWQESPFLVGVLEFLFQQSTLGSWIGYGLSAGALLCMLQLAMQFSQRSGPEQIAGLLVSICFTVLAISWSATFGSACLAVIQDTANGNEAIEDWPDWHFFDWFVRSFTLVVAMFVAAFPGLLVGSLMLTSGAPLIAIPLPVLASLVAFAPIVLTSMLVEGSVLSVVSPTVLRMVRTAADGWILFYMLTFVIGMLAVGALALLEMQNLLTSFIAGVLCVTLALLYSRLLGRLMWYSQHKLTEEEARKENRRRWAERAAP